MSGFGVAVGSRVKWWFGVLSSSQFVTVGLLLPLDCLIVSLCIEVVEDFLGQEAAK